MPQNSQENLDTLLVVVTCLPNLGVAKDIARELLDLHLAACVQIQNNITSMYRWEGKICDEQEVLLSAKTMANHWREISKFIKDKHPYDLPEILAISPEQYDQQYGNWVQSEVNSKS